MKRNKLYKRLLLQNSYFSSSWYPTSGACAPTTFDITSAISSFKLISLSDPHFHSTVHRLFFQEYTPAFLLVSTRWENTLNPPSSLLASLPFQLVSCTLNNTFSVSLESFNPLRSTDTRRLQTTYQLFKKRVMINNLLDLPAFSCIYRNTHVMQGETVKSDITSTF